jgi:NAD(P)-dependent dehydrogenase (short-subunit alcohol dehydrogenase family)/aryl carrier-like protein
MLASCQMRAGRWPRLRLVDLPLDGRDCAAPPCGRRQGGASTSATAPRSRAHGGEQAGTDSRTDATDSRADASRSPVAAFDPQGDAFAALLGIAASPARAPVVALRAGYLWEPTHRPLADAAAGEAWRAREGSYLITGGTGGVGLALAEGLAAAGARELILVARRPPAPAAEARLAQLAADGASVRCEALDVRDTAALGALLRQTKSLAGVVHAAMPPLGATDPTEIFAVKVDALLAMADALRDRPLHIVAACSSLASAMPSPAAPGSASAAYAAANACLDLWAQGSHPWPAIAIGWDTWREAGMAVAAVERGDAPPDHPELVAGLSNAEGWRTFVAALQAGEPLVRISTLDLPTRAAAAEADPAAGGKARRAAPPARPERAATGDDAGARASVETAADAEAAAAAGLAAQAAAASARQPAGERRAASGAEGAKGVAEDLGLADVPGRYPRPELSTDYRAPLDALEQALHADVAALLGIEQLGRDDDFYELGFDSLVGHRLVERARRRGLVVNLRDVLEAPTIAALAQRVRAAAARQ